MTVQVEKILSRNDVGATGAHQAGIAVPRLRELLEFFPSLDSSELNPRATIEFVDHSNGRHYRFNYIYYNGKLTGASTRNEYRLTGMSEYLRSYGAAAGDSVIFSKDESGYSISFQPVEQVERDERSPDVIVLSGKWLRKY